jgi:hypothetical protein
MVGPAQVGEAPSEPGLAAWPPANNVTPKILAPVIRAFHKTLNFRVPYFLSYGDGAHIVVARTTDLKRVGIFWGDVVRRAQT